MFNNVYKTLILALGILLITFSPTVHAQLNIKPDPIPLAKMLQDVVETILYGKYDDALLLCRRALNVSLPTDLLYVHRRLYRSIIKMLNLLTQVNAVNTSIENNTKLYILINELSIASREVIDTMKKYVDKLSPLFVDPTARSLVLEMLLNSAQNLRAKLESIVLKLIQLYLGAYGHEILIQIYHPSIVYGGETLDIDITLIANNSADYANLTMIIVYGDIRSEVLHRTIPIGRTITISVPTPDAKDIIIATDVKSGIQINCKIFIIAKIMVEGQILFGHYFSNFTLMYVTPSIKVDAPRYVYLGEDIKIRITASLDEPLSLSVYIDNVLRDNILTTLTVSSDEYVLVIPSSSIPIGHHKLIFVVEPQGRYLAYKYSHTLSVVLRKTMVTISLTPFVISPYAKTIIELYVDPPILYNATIYIDNNIVAKHTLINKSKISIELSFPPSLLLRNYRVSAKISPIDPTYSPSMVEGSVYVLSMESLAVMLVSSSLVLTTFSKIRLSRIINDYIIAILRVGKGSMKSFISRKRKILVSPISITTTNKYTHRKPRLFELYKKVIAIVSKYVQPPKDSETLREFYHRLYETYSGYTTALVKAFLELYEQDLYSNHKINIERAIQIVKRISEIENE